MRVALVCPYDLARPGGVQNHVLGLAAALRAAGHDARVLAPSVERTSVERTGVGQQISGGVSVRWNGSVAPVVWGPRTANAVRRWLLCVDPDLVHVHEPTAPSVGWHALRAADGRWPTVATFHQAGTPAWALTVARKGLRGSLGRLGAAICVSRAALEAAAPLCLPDPTIIGNGFDFEGWADAASEPKRRVVAFVGRRGDPRKGFSLFEEMACSMYRDHPDIDWWALGPGGDVRPPIIEPDGPGPLSVARLRERVGEAAVVVAPNTRGESFGLVLVEALAAGAQVVAADLPAFVDVLDADDGPVGRLHRAGDVASLSAAVRATLATPDTVDARTRRRMHARTYSWDAVLPQIMERYERAMGGTR